jgi:hypothetical protein
MPSFASVLEPKLTAIQTRLEGIKGKMQTSGAYAGLNQELAEVTTEAQFVQEFASRLVTMLRLQAEGE